MSLLSLTSFTKILSKAGLWSRSLTSVKNRMQNSVLDMYVQSQATSFNDV